MKQSDSDNFETKGQWERTAVYSAWVAGVFSVVVAALLFVNYLQLKVLIPLREERLEAMKLKVADSSADAQLVGQIRQLDLDIRRDRIRGQGFSHRGSYLLLGGFIVLIAGAKLVSYLRKQLPHPEGQREGRAEQMQEANAGRWAITAGLIVVGAGALIFALMPTTDYGGSEVSSYPSAEDIAANWARFRGPGGLGISAYTNVPEKFDVEGGEGIVWKTAIPLAGFNSPIVWGERVFISGGDEKALQVYCYDAANGKLLWTGDVPRQGEEKVNPMEDTGFAAPTMVTDGRRVYAIFATGDIGCFDFTGKRLWAMNLGVPDNAYGHASSLAMYRNLVLVQLDQGQAEDEKSRLIALEGFSGGTVWEVKRRVSGSWTSPIVIETEKGPQIITCADPCMIAYKATNGAELWRADCLGPDVAPSAVYGNGLVYAIHPYTKLVAYRADGTGDVTETHIAWTADEGISDICSPLTNGKVVLVLTTDGLLTCYDAKDGKKLWDKELEEEFFASPSFVGEKVYLLSGKGVLIVADISGGYKDVARSELGEKCFASPGFADGRIYIRGEKNLYRIGNRAGE